MKEMDVIFCPKCWINVGVGGKNDVGDFILNRSTVDTILKVRACCSSK